MSLPKLPNKIRHYQPQVIQFGGLNLTAGAKDGEFTATSGITTMNYPFISQMPEREVVGEYSDPTDLFMWNDYLYVVDGTDLKKNSTVIGTLDDEYAGARQFAVVNTKLVIYPDKVYIDLTDDSVNSLITKSEEYTTYTITDSSISATGIDSDFAVGDVLDVTGTGIEGKRIIVESTSTDTITFPAGSITLNNNSGKVLVQSSVPDLDFICASDNRLWGCCNDDHTVYASALGDPSTFFDYTSDLGAFSSAIGSEGLFTAIFAYNNTILVWKENRLYKFLGSFPSEYYMVESTIPGVKGGDHKSLVVINGLLYYSGPYGMYVYNGNRPQIISENLGLGSYVFGSGRVSGYADVCCATDGRLLYMGCVAQSAGDDYDEPWPNGSQLFAYDVIHGLWVNELDLSDGIMGMTQNGQYMLHWGEAGGRKNYITRRGLTINTRQPWYAEFPEIMEDTFNRKGYTKILLRIDIRPGSKVSVLAKEDNRDYREAWSGEIPAGIHTEYVKETITIPSGWPPHADFTALHDYHDLYSGSKTYAKLDGDDAIYTTFNDATYVLTAAFLEKTMTVDFSNGWIFVTNNDGTSDEGEHVVNVFTEFSDGAVTGSLKTIPIRLGRCDRYRIKLEGHGEVTIRGMAREFVSGSDIN